MRDLIYLLPVIACPIVMGVMMLVMMRGNHSQHDPAHRGDEVARLRAEVEQLRAQNPSSQVPPGQTPTASHSYDRPPAP